MDWFEDTELLPCTLEVMAVRLVMTVGAGLKWCWSVYLRSILLKGKKVNKKLEYHYYCLGQCFSPGLCAYLHVMYLTFIYYWYHNIILYINIIHINRWVILCYIKYRYWLSSKILYLSGVNYVITLPALGFVQYLYLKNSRNRSVLDEQRNRLWFINAA